MSDISVLDQIRFLVPLAASIGFLGGVFHQKYPLFSIFVLMPSFAGIGFYVGHLATLIEKICM